MKNRAVTILGILLLFLIVISCNQETVYTPKPRSYPKVEFPSKSYQVFNDPECSVIFEYPGYAEIDKNIPQQEATSDCWFDIFIEPFNGRIHCSYLPINNTKQLNQFINDAFSMVDKVNYRSNFSDEQVISRKDGTGGLIFKFDGPAASPVQFFLTDSTNHFLKGSLYFYSKVNPDSIQPIAEFIEKDIFHIISTLEWK